MARVTKTIDLVECVKLGEELPALEQPPFPGDLGERIYDNISKIGYAQWQQQATLIINHYGLNLADPNANEFLFQQMEDFLFGSGAGASIAGAPAGGGKGAPQRK